MENCEVKYLNVDEKQNVTYCIPLWLRDEQVKLSTARVKNRIETSYDLKDEPIAIVCYGPSLNDTWEEIKNFKYIMTCSGSHKFLLDRGIVPTWHVDVDPRPHKVELLGEPHKDVEYLIASTCHPNMFDKLEGYNVKLWHIFATEEEAYRILPQGEWSITGGGSVGLRAMTIARFFGFTNQHIFGMDGCEGKSGKHASFHPNQANGNFPTIYDGKTYYTTPAILECARQTFHELNQLKDVKPTFYGDGLVQAMHKNYIPSYRNDVIIAIRKPILISDEYRELNRDLHKTELTYGSYGNYYADDVLKLYETINAKSILDYGCGKGFLGKSISFPIWEYDPAVYGKDESPRPADLVVCIDVLEHIEPDKLNAVLFHIQTCTKKLVYFVIDIEPAKKTLSDGRNTHQIIENLDWWMERLSQYFNVGEPTMEGHRINVCASPKLILSNLCFPDNYFFATTMNKRLYDNPHHLSLKTLPLILQNKIYCFHENSIEDSGNIIPTDLDEVTYIDLFEDNPWLSEFLSASPFKDCHLVVDDYWKKNSPNWFRKVLSICKFIEKLEIGSVGVWVDCDCTIINQFPNKLFDYIEQNDWLSIYRNNNVIESGFYIFKINEKTKKFAEKYLEYFTSFEVFDEKLWTDNFIIEVCFNKYGQELKKSGLTIEYGCPVDILNYIMHDKGNLSKKIKIKK